ncbi:helix-hairpin-helix domain-containing protein, partial [bacterium]|nr:helix-hairpin-helix domain-containing protein [bacterium]
KWLTKEEQRIILFILVFVLVGSTIMFLKYKRVIIAHELLTAQESEHSPYSEVSEVNDSIRTDSNTTDAQEPDHYKKRTGLPANIKININTASAEELDFLPRIGPSTAAKIIEYREEHGGFKTISDIQKVKGIGPSTFEQMKDNITVKDE